MAGPVRLSLAGLLALAALAGLSMPVLAASDDDPDPDALAFGLGYFDIVKRRDAAAILNLEYRSDKRLWVFKRSGHNDWPSDPEQAWWDEVMDFLTKG